MMLLQRMLFIVFVCPLKFTIFLIFNSIRLTGLMVQADGVLLRLNFFFSFGKDMQFSQQARVGLLMLLFLQSLTCLCESAARLVALCIVFLITVDETFCFLLRLFQGFCLGEINKYTFTILTTYYLILLTHSLHPTTKERISTHSICNQILHHNIPL